MYKIYGDYALNTECLLHEADTRSEAIRWIDNYVFRNDDFGGYDTIEAIVFAADGEAVTEYCVNAEDYVGDYYEGDDDFALIDEF